MSSAARNFLFATSRLRSVHFFDVFRTKRRGLATGLVALCLAAVTAGEEASAASKEFGLIDARAVGRSRPHSGETIFSWDPGTLREGPGSDGAGSSDELGDAVLKSVSQNPRYKAENFWNRDPKWTGIFKLGDAAVSPAYFEMMHPTAPIDLRISSSEFDGPTVLGIAIALASLPLIGGLLHHRRYGGPIAHLSFYDCGKSGGFVVPH